MIHIPDLVDACEKAAAAQDCKLKFKITGGEAGWWHVTATVAGPSAEMVRKIAADVLHICASGRQAWIRVPPKSASDKNFATDTWEHRGRVRFSFAEKEGSWVIAPPRDGTLMGFNTMGRDSKPPPAV